MLHCLLRGVDHIVDHGSDDIVMLDAFNLDSLRPDNHPLNKGVCRPVEEPNLVLVHRDSHAELEISTIGVKESVATQQEFDHVARLGSVDRSRRLVAAELDLVLDRLRLDVCVVQAIGNNSVRGCHIAL